jgi:hypothetical protein
MHQPLTRLLREFIANFRIRDCRVVVDVRRQERTVPVGEQLGELRGKCNVGAVDRPISAPSGVTKEFRDMFCALNGATSYPSCRNIRHNAVAVRLLPTDDPVPCTITVRAVISSVPGITNSLQNPSLRSQR